MAISNSYVININGGKAVLDHDIYLTMGDAGVTLSFEIEGTSFNINDCTKFTMMLLSSRGNLVTVSNGTISNGILTISIPSANIDEINEVGTYAIQIKLLDGTNNTLSLPIIANQFHVKASLDNLTLLKEDAIQNGTIDSTHVSLGDGNTPNIFNPDKSYNATNWRTNDTITVERMNKIEKALSYLMDVTVKSLVPVNNTVDLQVEQKQVCTVTGSSVTINLPDMTGCAYADVKLLLNCTVDCDVTFVSSADRQTIKLINGYNFINLIYYADWIITC